MHMLKAIRVSFALASSLCFVGFYFWYGSLVRQGPEVVEPLLAQWLCFALATSLGLYAWLRTSGEGQDWLANCQNLMDQVLYVVLSDLVLILVTCLDCLDQGCKVFL